MKNVEIRNYAKKNDVKLWEIADVYGVSDITFSKKLRYELPEKDKENIMQIIDDLAKAKADE